MELPFARTWWIAPGRVLGGPFPGSIDPREVDARLERLLDVGVRDVVCLQEDDELGHGGRPFAPYHARLLHLGAARGLRVTWARFPVQDMRAPTVATMRAVLDRIHAQPAVTYVHCWGGHGRTGAVAGCWFREQGLSFDASIAAIQAARSGDPYLAGYGAPQAADQFERVAGWSTASGR